MFTEKCDMIVPKLIKVQKQLGGIAKDGRNPHFKSNYVTLEACLEESKPLLNAEGLFLSQAIDGDMVITSITDPTGQSLTSRCPIRTVKDDAQAMGSAITYARRYSLMSLLALGAEDDDGNAASRPGSPPLRAQATLAKPQAPKQASNSSSLGDYLVPFGKDKGKRLIDCDPANLSKTVDWIINQEKPSPQLQSYLQVLEEFLA